ncbi:MAG: hypothetical protein LHW56_08495 [Candidatus Cloacimonetes bacterium]|nr:hypothetical protein [Candidatus Cloacimonadota bacterium]MDY0172933.1 hypothetical protein [Candidatus Cloacimonadaceae bacterium]
MNDNLFFKTNPDKKELDCKTDIKKTEIRRLTSEMSPEKADIMLSSDQEL